VSERVSVPRITRPVVVLPFLRRDVEISTLKNSTPNLPDPSSVGRAWRLFAAEDAPSHPAALMTHVVDGTLQVKALGRGVLSDLKVRMTLAAGRFDLSLGEAAVRRGQDAAGQYTTLRYPLVSKDAQALPFHATLEMRHYASPETLVATLDYDGGPLEPSEGISVSFTPENFAAGLAYNRQKLHWTMPELTSTWRNLSSSNELLLWKRTGDTGFQMMAPLGGDGMVAELGMKDSQLRVALSSKMPGHSPKRIPLFTFATGKDPYDLMRGGYETGFATAGYYGKLRWQKGYPEVLRSLGVLSWNIWYQHVSAQRILRTAQMLRAHKVPVGFFLIDDGWHSIVRKPVIGVDGGTTNTPTGLLSGFDADVRKFPGGLTRVVRSLKEDCGFEHVGLWHALEGHWQGVDPDSEIGRSHALASGPKGLFIPDPRDGKGESFYADWYRKLNKMGVDLLKIDNQANLAPYVEGGIPAFTAAAGEQRNVQEAAASQSFGGSDPHGSYVNVLNSMSLSLENLYNYGRSNSVRTSDDYLPRNSRDAKEHVFANAYNSVWASNFAFPDYDIFQSHDPHAEYHAIARAMSGGPVTVSDKLGKENVALLRRMATPRGRLFMLDDVGRLPADLLMRDPSTEPIPMKLGGTITRPGLSATMVAAFNVNKSSKSLEGTLRPSDGPGLVNPSRHQATRYLVYQRSTKSVLSLDATCPALPFHLSEFGTELFTVVKPDRGVAVFGLTDKYLGPAAVKSVDRRADDVTVQLSDVGELTAWLDRAPSAIWVDGRLLKVFEYAFHNHVLTVPEAAFDAHGAGHSVRFQLVPHEAPAMRLAA
jgi:raffinose synthase